jgi:small nuclear ribonucleoprotein (snRNP)-like protein
MVVTCDGRIIVGKFIGHDQVQNIILSDSHERVYSVASSEEVNNPTTTNTTTEVKCVPTGLHVIRGDTVCLIGEFDETKIDNSVQVPFPLPSIQQQQF